MNILITGANGQLGNEMRIVSAGSADKYVFTDVAELDITSKEAVMDAVRGMNADIIVNCAAYTNVDAAETDFDRAELLNVGAVRNLADAMKAVGGLLVHVSTDYVFGDSFHNTPIGEDAECAPSGAYGLTKLHGEQQIAASGCRSLIFRTAWLYSEFGRNFVKTMLSLTASKPSLNVVFDQAGTPTYALGLARTIFGIIESRSFEGREGIYHYSDEGVCSWYDFAVEIARLAGHTGCDIRPCHSSEFPSPVRRPSYSVLDKTKIKNTFGTNIKHWTASLAECIDNMNLSK
ncbi:MAG: dTDP-4-dehydrorhamnose reductase [Bacteroidales bacterium]|nr:dTDP-4-dehydrorhamnose reductase [Bacteroidales bacterium]